MLFFHFRWGNTARKEAFHKEREQLQNDLKASEGGIMVHADGKKMSQDGEVVERFPIAFSGFPNGKTHIWKIPVIENG